MGEPVAWSRIRDTSARCLQGQVGLSSRIGSMVRHLEASGFGLFHLAERLVGPEAHDGQSQGIDGQLIVLHVLPEDIRDAGGPSFSLDLGMIRRVRIHLLEFDSSGIRRLSEVIKNDVLDLDIDIWK